MTKAILRKNDELTAIEFIDDFGDNLYLAGHEFGPTHLIRAMSYESAHEAWIDELPTIDDGDVHEAYGAYDRMREWMQSRGHEDTIELRRFCCDWAETFFGMKCRTPDVENWELIEGYEYQSNASGTGIVNVGHYSQLEPVARWENYEVHAPAA